jgi:hypothetical protein
MKVSPKGFSNPYGKALFFANFNNGALKTAPYGIYIDFYQKIAKNHLFWLVDESVN